MQPRPFVARSERLTTAIDLPPRPAGAAAPSGSDANAEKRPDAVENPGASAPTAAPPPSGDQAAPASPGAGDPAKPGSEDAEGAPTGSGTSADAARSEASAVPWPHSGSDSNAAPKPAPDATAGDPSSAPSGEATRLKSNDLTRPFPRGPEPAGSGNGSPADAAQKKGAHALHTGAYPVVSEPVSMRPRNEPPPEPAELFRPAARDEKRTSPAATPETTVKVSAVKPSNG